MTQHYRATWRRAPALCTALCYAGLLAIMLLSGSRICLGQESRDPPTIEEDTTPEISREEWRMRIQQARKRAKDVALDRRLNPQRYLPPPEDPDIAATERVLRDESLQHGDIVVTKKGLFVFRGRSDQPRSDADFIALPPR